jgi:hypothetical protein
MRAHMPSPSKANRLIFPDTDALERQKAESNPLCSTLHEEMPPTYEPPTPPQPHLMPPPPAPETASAALLALPTPPTREASDASPLAEPSDEPQLVQVDPQRRLEFARYLYRSGVFNEGFPSNALPAQYRHHTTQE